MLSTRYLCTDSACDGRPEQGFWVENWLVTETTRGLNPGRVAAPRLLTMRIIAGSRKGHRSTRRRASSTRPTGGPRPRGRLQPGRPASRARRCSTSSPAPARWGSRRSRAAPRSAVFVESDRDACRAIDRNLDKLGLTGAKVAAATCSGARRTRPRRQALRSRAGRPALPEVLLPCTTPRPLPPDVLAPGRPARRRDVCQRRARAAAARLTSRRYGSARADPLRAR